MNKDKNGELLRTTHLKLYHVVGRWEYRLLFRDSLKSRLSPIQHQSTAIDSPLEQSSMGEPN